jgi:hypothetical protein
MEKIPKKGYLYFHQGWTDIINQLSLISYYSERYENICCIMRKDAKPLLDFYTRPLTNVEMLYSNYVGINNCSYDRKILEEPNIEILFHGLFDVHRSGHEKKCSDLPKPKFFVNRFYECYGIDYKERVDSFSIKRDFESENFLYDNFTKLHGKKYILHHFSNNSENITSIDNNLLNLLQTKILNNNSINLNNKTNVFFDYIKILENSHEMHLMDSVWASIVYHLDSKYGLFKNIPIYIYCLRGYTEMFTQPIQLSNWIII